MKNCKKNLFYAWNTMVLPWWFTLGPSRIMTLWILMGGYPPAQYHNFLSTVCIHTSDVNHVIMHHVIQESVLHWWPKDDSPHEYHIWLNRVTFVLIFENFSAARAPSNWVLAAVLLNSFRKLSDWTPVSIIGHPSGEASEDFLRFSQWFPEQ
jgi:hypothetical protein